MSSSSTRDINTEIHRRYFSSFSLGLATSRHLPPPLATSRHLSPPLATSPPSSITRRYQTSSTSNLSSLFSMFASPAPVVKRSLARGSTATQNALTSISLIRPTSHVRTRYSYTDQIDSELTILCPLQGPVSYSVSMIRSTSRAGESNQGYATTPIPGCGSHPVQRSISSTMANVGSAAHLSPSLGSYGLYTSPSKGFPFPTMTPTPNASSLPMSRGASASAGQYEPMEEAFENLNMAYESTHYTSPFPSFDIPIARGRYTRTQTPIAPPLLLSMSRHFPVLSEAHPIPSPSLGPTSSVPVSVRPRRLRSILKSSSRNHLPSPAPTPGAAPTAFESVPVLFAPSIPKRTTFSNTTTEIGGRSSSAREELDVVYRSCRGRPPTPLPEMMESDGEASD
jgi:hypothetical protein